MSELYTRDCYMMATKAAARFNKRYPVGTLVRYWTGSCDVLGKVSRTKTIASVLGGHTAVVWVENESSCFALSHIEPITEIRR